MTMQRNIRFSTNLITFYDPPYWNLPADTTYSQWEDAFANDAQAMFLKMFDATKASGLEGIEFAPGPAGWEGALRAFGNTDRLMESVERSELVVTSSYAAGRQFFSKSKPDASAMKRAEATFRKHAEFLVATGGETIILGNLPRSRFGLDSPDDTATAADFQVAVPRTEHQYFADQLNHVGQIVKEYGVKIAIHTDAYSICVREEDIGTVMELTDPDVIAICPDAGHIALDGGDPNIILDKYIDRIPTMHWKDCIGPLGGHTLRGDGHQRHDRMIENFRVLGSGNIDWVKWMEILKKHSWSGWATEEIDNSPDPEAELRQGLEYFETTLRQIYS